MDTLLRHLLPYPPFSAFYALPEPQLPRTRPMKVLALGLSRCGTESLKCALEELGYKGVYHGFETTGSHSVSWCKMLDAKFSNKSLGRETTTEDFDRIIGNYEAVTDTPTCMLGEEIVRAYPDAKVCAVLSKYFLIFHISCISALQNSVSQRVGDNLPSQVILNRRKDIDTWERSFQETLCNIIRDKMWLKALAWLSADYFWLRQMFLRYLYDFFDGSFEKNAKAVYEEHFRKLEELLGGPKSGRYLSWTVEDGWYVLSFVGEGSDEVGLRDADNGAREPLCDFLGKEMPNMPFPSGNAPDAFMARIGKRRESQIRTAKRNGMMIVGTVFAVGVALALSR